MVLWLGPLSDFTLLSQTTIKEHTIEPQSLMVLKRGPDIVGEFGQYCRKGTGPSTFRVTPFQKSRIVQILAQVAEGVCLKTFSGPIKLAFGS